nr:hypothetical protein [uncultured Desulfobacter sp.]
MNSLNKNFKILAMVFILSIALNGYATGTDPIPSSWSEPDQIPLARGQTAQQDSSAKKIALSGAAHLLKDTRIGKNLNQYRRHLIRNVRFEYRKTIGSNSPDVSKPIPQIAQRKNDKKESLKSVSFSGELGPNLSPVVEFNSRLNIVYFSSAFDLIDHEVECDISSRPVNEFLGGKAAIGFSSDGEKTEALIRLKFDL